MKSATVSAAGDPEVPLDGVEDADEARLVRLERTRLIRRVPRIRLEEIARTLPPAQAEHGADAVAALIEERRAGL